MDNIKLENFGSKESTHQLWLLFSSQVQVLHKVYEKVMQEKSELWSVTIPLLYAINDSCDSLSFLTQRGKVRDSFVLARTIYEGIINTSFILSKGLESAKLAKEHALQKSYRDTNRKLEINDGILSLELKPAIDLSGNPEILSALAKFTNKKGREITSWTPETVKEQVEIIDKKYGADISTGLQFALMAIYRHASEISHGTYFGALFSLGLTSASKKPQSPEDIAKNQRENISMLLLMIALSIESLISIIAKELTLDDLKKESNDVRQNYLEQIKS